MSLDMMKFMAALMITNSHFQPLYEVQVLALVPLHGFVYYGYKVASYKWTDWCFGKRFLGKGISLVAGFTL